MRLIDADTLKLNFLHLQEHIIQAYGEIDEYVRCLDNAIETYIDVNYFRSIEEAPTIDAVPVVRCEECEFWERDRISCEGMARCRTGESGVRFRAKYDYCSRGIPKGKDGNKE